VLGHIFGTLFDFFFWAVSTWGTVLGLFSYGGSIKVTSFGFFWSLFLVWAHLRDFILRFLGPTLKLLGTLFFPWAHLTVLFGFKSPLSQSIFKRPLKP